MCDDLTIACNNFLSHKKALHVYNFCELLVTIRDQFVMHARTLQFLGKIEKVLRQVPELIHKTVAKLLHPIEIKCY